MYDFIWLALAAGLGLTLATGPLGSFLVWRRMAFFGDTLAHGALLGVALALFFHVSPSLGVVVASVVLGLLITTLQGQRQLGNDTLLGILSHTTLGLGVIAISVADTTLNLENLLFGDILAVTPQDLLMIYAATLCALGLIVLLWRRLIAITVQPELAAVEGINVKAVQLGLTFSLALCIAVAMQVVGVLLVTALLIIPAAAVRSISSTPEQMAVYASVLGGLAVALGLAASWQWDVPTGPAIVVSASLLLLLLQLFARRPG